MNTFQLAKFGFVFLVTANCVQGRKETSKQKSVYTETDPTIATDSKCGSIPVTKKMSLKKNQVNGLKFWTTGFELINLESGSVESPHEKTKDGSKGVAANILGTMGEPPVSVKRTFQMNDANNKLVVEGRESIFSSLKKIEVFECDRKTYIGKVERHAGDAGDAVKLAFGKLALGAEANSTSLFKMVSVFVIYDKNDKVVGYSRKSEFLATEFSIEEVIDSKTFSTKSDNTAGNDKKPANEPDPTKETWKILRGVHQGGYFDNWEITKTEDSKLDYRLVLMIPAFKTDIDASLPGSFSF